MALPNNKVRIKRRARRVAGLIYSVYNPLASNTKVNQVAQRSANSVIYAPNKGKWVALANPVAWLMHGANGVIVSAKDAKFLLTKKGRKISRKQKINYLKEMKYNFSPPDMSEGYFFHPLLRKVLITRKTAGTVPLVHELTHKLRGLKFTNVSDANSLDRYFGFLDSVSTGNMDARQLAEFKQRAKSGDFSKEDVSNVKFMYGGNFVNRLRGFLKSAGLFEEHARFLKEPGSLNGGGSGGRIAFMADLRFKKPFMGLIILKSLGEGKTIETAFIEAHAGKYDSQLERIYKLNPVMARHYSNVVKKAVA